MEATQFIAAVTGHRDEPGYTPTPDDELRALLNTLQLARILIQRLENESGSPTRVLLLAEAVELAHRELEITQIAVAQLAQRNLIHELSAEILTGLRGIADNPTSYVEGTIVLPPDPTAVPTGRLEFKNPAECLEGSLGITYFEAQDRLAAAEALLPHLDEHGIQLGPRYPQLADQLRAGKARLRPTADAARRLDKLRPSIQARPDAARLARELEERVATSVATGIAKNTRKLFDQLGDELEGATMLPNAAEIREKTGVFVTKRTRHFTYLSVCMLNLDAEVFMSHFARSDNPRTNAGNRHALFEAATLPGKNPDIHTDPNPEDGAHESQHPPETTSEPASQIDGPDWFTRPANAETFDDQFNSGTVALGSIGPGSRNSTEPGPDGLTRPQRYLQTLLNLMRAPNSPPARGTTGLPRANIVVYVYLETLLGLATGAGWTAHGLEVPVGHLRRQLATEGVIPMVLGGQSEILDVGQEMRFAPDYMKRAVLARDGGCLFPGCSVPPEHLEFHHIDQFQNGGGTSVGSLIAQCTAHHHGIDNGELKVIMHNGLPHLLLPKYLDPEQIPRRNSYWQGPKPTLF